MVKRGLALRGGGFFGHGAEERGAIEDRDLGEFEARLPGGWTMGLEIRPRSSSPPGSALFSADMLAARSSSKSDPATLGGLLREEYQLDPGAIEYLLEEALRQAPDHPVQVACHLLRGPLSETQRQNLGEFIRRAIALNPDVRLRFEKSAKRMGPCPKGEKGWLRSQLRSLEFQHLTSPVRKPDSYATRGEVVALDNLHWAIDELPELINRLGRTKLDRPQIEIRLGDFTYASALAVLAEWILSQGIVNSHEITCGPLMQSYLDRIRFSSALRNREIKVSPDEMDWAVGLTRINQDLPTHEVTNKIVDIIDTFIHPAGEERQALQILLAEMIENVHRHAEALQDGFAVAQVYPRRLKMGITLVDGGIGVRSSFERGDPSIPISALKTDADFLREACNLHSTSKRTRHSGYGLYLLTQVIARNRGTFLLCSGRATLIGFWRNGKLVLEERSHEAWQGTIVGIVVDLNRPLPLLDVYKSMPAPTGYHIDDLFIE